MRVFLCGKCHSGHVEEVLDMDLCAPKKSSMRCKQNVGAGVELLHSLQSPWSYTMPRGAIIVCTINNNFFHRAKGLCLMVHEIYG